MKLDEICFAKHSPDAAYTQAWLLDRRVFIAKATDPRCEGADRKYEVGNYYIWDALLGRKWEHLPPLEAQCILYHLLGGSDETTAQRVPE